MRNILMLGFAVASAYAQTVPNIKNVLFCPNSPDGRQPYTVRQLTSGDLRKVVINAANAVCNDGTPAVMYVRPATPGAFEPDGLSANRWLIHFLGGSSCSDFDGCFTRWCGLGQWAGTLMTTSWEGDFTNVSGLLGRNSVNRLGDRNEVLLKYCSSDNWQGRKSDVVLRSDSDPSKAYSLNFQGATIVSAVLDALERGVAEMPRLTDATDVLVSGDSAGATGVRAHLDRIAARLKVNNPSVRVRGEMEATLALDFNGKQGFPPGDPRDPPFANKSALFNRVQVGQRNAQLDDSCVAAHPSPATYLCSDDGFLELNHITTPIFQIQDIQDPIMLNGLEDAGFAGTVAQIAQRLDDQMVALANIRNTAVEKASINSTPGVGGRNCAVHVAYSSDDGFLGKRIRSGPGANAYSYYDLLWNWMIGASPSNVVAPRPPSAPDPPVTDSICDARAPTAPPLPAIATASSASYDFAGPVAPESIVDTFGTNLATTTVPATTVPLPMTLGGIQVTVTDSRGTARSAPLYYVSPTQVLYLIPAGTATGTAQIAIGNQRTSVVVDATAPGIFSADATGRGVAAATYIRIPSRGASTQGYIFDPTTKADTGVPAVAGDQIYLLLYGTGMRGGPATATVSDVNVSVAGPVAQSQYQGLDQINLGPLPFLGLGQKQIVIRQGDRLANIVTVTFRAP